MDKVTFKLVTEEHRKINYCDGYDRYVFVSNRDATMDEFINFLKENKFQISPKEKWYNDYSEIHGSGKTWTYRWVNVYVD